MRAGQIEQRIAAEADIGLLADRDEAGIAGEQIPQLRKREVIGHLGDEPHPAGIAPPRQRDERGEHRRRDHGEDAAGLRCALDALGRRHLKSLVRGNSPLGRTIRMIRKAIWPARICQVGDSAAPTACAMPSTTPPISVPHMLPSPPMITASKARISRIGPAAGSKMVRMANSTPAIAVKIMAMPSASA